VELDLATPVARRTDDEPAAVRAQRAWWFEPLVFWITFRVSHLVIFRLAGNWPHGASYQWDDGFYRQIVRHGYYRIHEESWQPTNFFPLIAWLVRAVQVFVVSETLAILIVTTAAQIAAALAVYETARRLRDRSVARWSLALFLAFPAALFLWMLYAEALFVALSAGALLAAHRDRPLLAGVAGAAVAMTRVVGIMIVLPLAVAHLVNRRRIDRDAAWLALPFAGLGVVMFMQWWQGGDALGFAHTTGPWGHTTTLPWQTVIDRIDIARTLHLTGVNFAIDVGAQLAFVALAALAIRNHRRWPLPLLLWFVLMTIAHLASGLKFSWARYMLDAWPGFIVAADWMHRRPRVARWALLTLFVLLTVNRYQQWGAGSFIG
jgi:hypothetical protein